tara:strand:+ start:117 stop:1430 length:1314 start_codon:yes stop_codon:yes gene_type:complete
MKLIFEEFLHIEKGNILFIIGIFLLLSAPSISAIFLLISLVISISKHKSYCLTNKSNYPFLIFGAIILINVLIRTYFLKINIDGFQPYLNIVGIANWLPFIGCYIFFQPYLNNLNKRKNVIYAYLSGSIPLFISGFGQKFFDWFGPIGIFRNLIIWFQRPITDSEPMEGLFNNPNYTGSWFLLLVPLCLACLKVKNNKIQKKIFLLIFLGLLIFSIILTESRNALLGSLLTFTFLTNKISSLFLLVGILLLIVAFASFFILIAPKIFYSTLNLIFPEVILNTLNLNQLNSNSFLLENSARLSIWQESIKLIYEKPFLGWGSGNFSILFGVEKLNKWIYHPHNLIMEVAISYGIITSLIFLFMVLKILALSFYKVYLKNKNIKNSIFDKAWWTAFFTLFISQMFDIQYFDFRIGITFWIFLSGLTCMIKKKEGAVISS